jgi:hypothetical protein
MHKNGMVPSVLKVLVLSYIETHKSSSTCVKRTQLSLRGFVCAKVLQFAFIIHFHIVIVPCICNQSLSNINYIMHQMTI